MSKAEGRLSTVEVTSWNFEKATKFIEEDQSQMENGI